MSSKKGDIMSYLSAFPDYDGELFVPKGWVDYSYKNDLCPRAMKIVESETECLRIEFSLWQDYVDVDKREYDNRKRFTFEIMLFDGKGERLMYYYETDDFEEAKRLCDGVQDFKINV